MAISLVNHNGDQTNAAATNTIPITLTTLPTVGNALTAFTRTGSGVSISSVSDPRGNTWTVDIQSTLLNAVSAITRCNVVNPYTAGDVITFNLSTSVASCQGFIVEWSGFLTTSTPFDQSAQAQGSAKTTNPAGPTGATTAGGELFLSALSLGATGATFTVPSGYTEIAFGLTTPRLDAAYLLNQPSGSTPSVTWSWAVSTNFGITLATYKAAPTSGANQALMLLGAG